MPFANQLHVDQLLGNVSIKYQNTEYIASQIFPEVPVQKESDLYRVYNRQFRIPETKRANKAEAREHNFEVSTASYTLERHALKDYISDEDVINYDQASLRADTTEELTDKLLLRLEKNVAQLFTSTNWSLNVSLAATAAFTANTTVSNPIPVFDTAATTVLQNSGRAPNFGWFRQNTFVAIKNHVSVLDRTKYTSSNMTLEMMRGLFDLPELLVAKAVEDTAHEGLAASISNIWEDHAFVGYKPPRAGLLFPSSGYIFKRATPMVKRYRVEERNAECIEVNMQYVPKVVASLSGYLIKDTE